MNLVETEQTGNKIYAGFWIRVGAILIDFIVFMPFVFLSFFSTSFSSATNLMLGLVIPTCYPVYIIFCHYKFGATLGKMAFKIKVVQETGSPLSLQQAILRSIADIVLGIVTIVAEIWIWLVVKNGPVEVSQIIPFDIREYQPAWLNVFWGVYGIWLIIEIIFLLSSEKKRSLHDRIAGTVVVRNQFALSPEQDIEVWK